MYRIDDPSASPTLPAPEAALTEGYWTEGNPATGTPATLERASWFNMVQEELRAIPVAAGIVPSKVVYTQILAALMSMFSPVVGSVRNLLMNVTAASATATMTADEIIVETALGGQTFRLASFNKTINLATTGAGGMDTGTAPVSGFVALYAIYNPTTATAALLATNATAAVAPNVYGGANMPSGYTASALVSVWPTNSSSQFAPGTQVDRVISVGESQVASGTAVGTSGNPVALASTSFPKNARRVSGWVSLTNTVANTNSQALLSSVVGQSLGARRITFNSAAIGGQIQSFANLPITTPQTLFAVVIVNANSCAWIITVSEYEI